MLQKKNYKLIAGKTLVILGTILGIHPFAIFFSIPMFFIGNYLIHNFSDYSKKAKFKWILIPIIVIAVIWIAIVVATEIFKRIGILE